MNATLDEKVVSLERAFRTAELPHAFGGAIALAYYATPRGTHDVDVNLFVPTSAADRVLAVLAALGADPIDDGTRAQLQRDGQVRVRWAGTPLDLFFSYDELHEACHQRRRMVPFPGQPLTILSPEDLAIFKVLFDRAKDWQDLEELLFAQAERFDDGYARDWLERILAADDARLARFSELLALGQA